MELDHVTKGKHEVLEEERKGLLSESSPYHDEDYDDEDIPEVQHKSRRWLYGAAIGFIVLILGAVFVPPLVRAVRPPPKPVADFDSQKLRSNGTHLFKKTALIVSIDGLR